MKRVVRSCIPWLVIVMAASCGWTPSVPIGKIVNSPRDYAEKQVSVSGEVTDVFSLFVVKWFTIRDRTGELTVVSSKPLPQKGSRIKVRGTVKEAFSIGDKQLLVLIESDGEE